MQRSAQSMSPVGATTLSYVEASGESRLACSRDELECLRCFMTSFFPDFQRRSHRQPLSWPVLKTQPEHNQEMIFRHEPPNIITDWNGNRFCTFLQCWLMFQILNCHFAHYQEPPAREKSAVVWRWIFFFIRFTDVCSTFFSGHPYEDVIFSIISHEEDVNYA